jgi:small redox-active disulfide protein 2
MGHFFKKEILMKKIVILGPGCPKCRKLAENARKAAGELGLDYEVKEITNIAEIAKLGVMMTPGLAVDGQIKSIGKLLSADEIKKILDGPAGPNRAGYAAFLPPN